MSSKRLRVENNLFLHCMLEVPKLRKKKVIQGEKSLTKKFDLHMTQGSGSFYRCEKQFRSKPGELTGFQEDAFGFFIN